MGNNFVFKTTTRWFKWEKLELSYFSRKWKILWLDPELKTLNGTFCDLHPAQNSNFVTYTQLKTLNIYIIYTALITSLSELFQESRDMVSITCKSHKYSKVNFFLLEWVKETTCNWWEWAGWRSGFLGADIDSGLTCHSQKCLDFLWGQVSEIFCWDTNSSFYCPIDN